MSWLFPIDKRDFPGRRWLSITLRTFHLMGIAGLAGAYLFHLPESQWMPYLWLAVLSGFLMAAMAVYVDGIWLLQLRGQAIFLKLLLLSTVFWLFDEPQTMIYLLVILISGVVSHAPGKVRYYSLWHRKVLTKADLINKNCGES
ncbi:hypothetical protein QKW35_04875 [Pontibacterium granulatum]|uniref:hypothetical protein n=1 Tax=Pontibacterium granulatum TaxID=2036029 RepID=UPI00249AB7CA|nr:hypothetical protein [Pontibacterium granulatum]MDI3323706.1 hypothetical protein [Pontibacterium granulatum]